MVASCNAPAAAGASLLPEDEPLARQYLAALLVADRHRACRLVMEALESGVPIQHLYLRVFQPAQYELGRLWAAGRISVAQEHYCTAATQLAMAQLSQHLFTTARNGHSLVATCVAGDLHELGARMVADFFELAGWSTYYCGADTPHADVVGAVLARRAGALAISATMPEHVEDVARLVGAMRRAPGCADVRIVVGGQPFNDDCTLWRRIGADAWAPDAQRAVAETERLLAGAAHGPVH